MTRDDSPDIERSIRLLISSDPSASIRSLVHRLLVRYGINTSQATVQRTLFRMGARRVWIIPEE